MRAHQRRYHDAFRSPCHSKVIEQDDDGTVSPEEYIIFNLKKMGKVDDDTIDLLRDQFDALDADGSGELDEGDIDMLEKACLKMESSHGA